MWERHAAGHHVEHWRLIHDRLNGLAPMQAASPPSATTVGQVDDPWRPLILACPDHNPGCCAHPAAFCSRFLKDVSRDECIACLSEKT